MTRKKGRWRQVKSDSFNTAHDAGRRKGAVKPIMDVNQKQEGIIPKNYK